MSTWIPDTEMGQIMFVAPIGQEHSQREKT